MEKKFMQLYNGDMMEEDLEYLKKNDLIAVLLLMFDNDRNTGKEGYLLQLIIHSMELGVLENIMYSIWEAVRKFLQNRRFATTHHAIHLTINDKITNKVVGKRMKCEG